MKQYFIFTIVIALNLEGLAQIDTSLLTRYIYAAEDSMTGTFRLADYRCVAGGKHSITEPDPDQKKQNIPGSLFVIEFSVHHEKISFYQRHAGYRFHKID